MPQSKRKPDDEQEQREQQAPQQGGTPGGASESPQQQKQQSPPGDGEEEQPRPLPGSTEAELPEYDAETARGVNVIPVGGETNPGLRYDDDAAGKPEDGQDKVAEEE